MSFVAKNATKMVSKAPAALAADFRYGATYAPYMFEANYTMTAGTGGWQPGLFRDYGKLSLMPMVGSMHYGLQGFSEVTATMGPKDTPLLFRAGDKAAELARVCDRLSFPAVDSAEYVEAISELVRMNKAFVPTGKGQALRLRTTVIGNNANLSAGAADEIKLYIVASPIDVSAAKPLKVTVDTQVNKSWVGGTGAVNMGCNYAVQVLHEGNAKKAGYDAMVFTSPEGNVQTVGQMNVFYVSGTELVTPPLDGLILPGVTRASVVTLAASLGLTVSEFQFTPEMLVSGLQSGKISEVFATGGNGVVQSIGSLDVDGSGAVAIGATEVASKIQAALLEVQAGGNADLKWTTAV